MREQVDRTRRWWWVAPLVAPALITTACGAGGQPDGPKAMADQAVALRRGLEFLNRNWQKVPLYLLTWYAWVLKRAEVADWAEVADRVWQASAYDAAPNPRLSWSLIDHIRWSTTVPEKIGQQIPVVVLDDELLRVLFRVDSPSKQLLERGRASSDPAKLAGTFLAGRRLSLFDVPLWDRLVRMQNPDGSWGEEKRQGGKFLVTCQVLLAVQGQSL